MKAKLSIILTGVVLVAGVFILILVNLAQSKITSSYTNNQPLIQVSDNLKYKTTVGHLWFEEFMAGDDSIDPEKDVIAQFENASKILTDVSEGNASELGTFEKISDAEMKLTIRKALDELDALKMYTRERWKNKLTRDHAAKSDTLTGIATDTGEQAGGDLDTKFDAAFEKTQLSLDEFKKLINEKVENDTTSVRVLSIVVSFLLASIFLGIAYMAYRFQTRNEKTAEAQAIKLEKENIRIGKMTTFADQIGQGNYEFALQIEAQETDSLAIALSNMKEKLKHVAEEDKKRNWVNIGHAKIGEIIRNTTGQADDFYFNMVSYLVGYLNANQGGLFVINDQNKDDIFIELKACLAYEKKKFIEKRIEIGEGLVGRCMQEAESIYMTKLPDNYITITSGLGQATPGCLLLVPLKITQEIFGILEIASFHPFEAYQIEFVEKSAESLAAAISGVKASEQTRILLEKAQQQAEELRAQEEEMRQNMEELEATQEEMRRKELEINQTLSKAQEKEQESYLLAARSQEEKEKLEAKIELLQKNVSDKK